VRPGPEGSRRRVLVIGSGRRIRNNFLPALAHLAPRLEVNGLWSPTAAHAEAAARPWGFAVRPVEATLASVDTVVVSCSFGCSPMRTA
jgi:predicted dehydrogenase